MTGYGWNNPDPALLAKADRVAAALAELEAAMLDLGQTPGSLGFEGRERGDTLSSASGSLRRVRTILTAYVSRVRAHPWP